MPVHSLVLLLGLIVTAAPAAAQAPATDPPAVTYKLTGARLAVAQDAVIAQDEEVSNGVAVLGGSLRVDGRVREGVLVVGGDLHLGPRADVGGDVLLVGGTLIRDPGSRLGGSVSYASFGEWSRGTGLFSGWPRVEFGGTGRWLSLAATILRIGVLAALMVLVLLLARAPVARVGRAAANEPVRAALVGLAAEVLFLPVLLVFSIALGITIIGLPFVFLLVPVALLLALTALLLGYTALACRIGEWLEDRLGWRPQSAYLATALGLLIVVLPTMVARVLGVAPAPLQGVTFGILMAGIAIEFVVWTIGLGAALMTGFGRYNLAPPPLDARP